MIKSTVLTVTPENFEKLHEKTGRPIHELEKIYLMGLEMNTTKVFYIEETRVSVDKLGQCFYTPMERADGRVEHRCVIHNQPSRHQVDVGSRMPCLALDPWE